MSSLTVINHAIIREPLLRMARHGHLGRHVASFTKEVNPRLAKRPLKTNGRLANRGLTSLVKEANGRPGSRQTSHAIDDQSHYVSVIYLGFVLFCDRT